MATVRIGGKPNNISVQHNISKQGLAAKKTAKLRKQMLYVVITVLIIGALYVIYKAN